MILARLFLLFSLFFIFSCNSNKTEEEMDELWSKAQTRQSILERSGTKFNSAMDMDLAMRDAETRLQTGGGLLGKGGLSVSGILQNKKILTNFCGMNVNVFLWRGALETINFMPLNSADQTGYASVSTQPQII